MSENPVPLLEDDDSKRRSFIISMLVIRFANIMNS